MLSLQRSIHSIIPPLTRSTPCIVQLTAKFHKEKVEAEPVSSIGRMIQYIKFSNFFYHEIKHHVEHDKWCKMFCIEGNINSGKTDFAKKFSERLELKNFDELTDYSYHYIRDKRISKEELEYELSGKSVNAIARNTSLEKFLNNPDDLIHTMRYQLERQKSKFIQFCDAQGWFLTTAQGVVLKNNHYCDIVHMHALRKMKWTTKRYKDVHEQNEKYVNYEMIPPQVVIYLDVSPEQCYENTQKSGTELEKKLPLDYYKYIEEGYKDIFMPKADELGINVIQVDWSKPTDIDEVIDDLDELQTLDHPDGPWNISNRFMNIQRKWALDSFKRYQDMDFINATYHDYDELDLPHWTNRALRAEAFVVPWKYRNGLNAELGDTVGLRLFRHLK